MPHYGAIYDCLESQWAGPCQWYCLEQHYYLPLKYLKTNLYWSRYWIAAVATAEHGPWASCTAEVVYRNVADLGRPCGADILKHRPELTFEKVNVWYDVIFYRRHHLAKAFCRRLIAQHHRQMHLPSRIRVGCSPSEEVFFDLAYSLFRQKHRQRVRVVVI